MRTTPAYLCAKACHLIGRRTKYLEIGEERMHMTERTSSNVRIVYGLTSSVGSRNGLWSCFQPVQSTSSPFFASSMYTRRATISSNQPWHTACLLLLNAMPRSAKLDGVSSSSVVLAFQEDIYAASRSQNQHQGCLNNAVPATVACWKVLEPQERAFGAG